MTVTWTRCGWRSRPPACGACSSAGYLSATAACWSHAYRLPVSEGVLVYLLGLVVIATAPGGFWFGFALAVLPIAVGLLLKVYDSARGHPR